MRLKRSYSGRPIGTGFVLRGVRAVVWLRGWGTLYSDALGGAWLQSSISSLIVGQQHVLEAPSHSRSPISLMGVGSQQFPLETCCSVCHYEMFWDFG